VCTVFFKSDFLKIEKWGRSSKENFEEPDVNALSQFVHFNDNDLKDCSKMRRTCSAFSIRVLLQLILSLQR